MKLKKLIESRLGDTYICSLLAVTKQVPFPYPSKQRDVVLQRLNEMSRETHDALEIFIRCPHGMLFVRRHLSDTELYMLRMRVLCGLNIARRLLDAIPDEAWLQTADEDTDREDCFLYSGVWQEFGGDWLSQVAELLVKGVCV